jgi:cytochrome P450
MPDPDRQPSMPDVDIFDPTRFGAEGVPYDDLARLRTEHPVSWHAEPSVLGAAAGPGYWAVTRHQDVAHVLRHPEDFSSWLGATQIRDPSSPGQLEFVRKMMLNMDPPEHSRLRGMLARSFTPKAITALESQITVKARELVDGVADRDSCDFVKDVSADLPLTTVAEVFGVPRSDRWLMYDWSNRVIGYQDPDYSVSDSFDPEGASPMAQTAVDIRRTIQPGPDGLMPDPRTRDGLADMYAYATELANEKRRNPAEDIVSLLLHTPDDEGELISEEEFEMMFFLFAVAGNETVRNGIPGGLFTLLQHPDQYRKLVAEPDLLASAIEEMLRYWPPVIHFRRTATRSLELGGQQIERGDKVVVYHAAANRDPQVFDDPNTFDITREKNTHITFGSGPHFCLGAHLARQQMRSMFTEVLWRMPELELAGDPVRLTSNFQNGLKSLPIRWAAG